ASEGMALAASFGALLCSAAFMFLAAALGSCLLRLLKIQIESCSERLLFFATSGVICFELCVALALPLIGPRPAVFLCCGLLASAGIFGIPETLRDVRAAARGPIEGFVGERNLAALVLVIALAEAVAAVAPLTSSDALHYHFAIPAEYLRQGFQPDWSITQS